MRRESRSAKRIPVVSRLVSGVSLSLLLVASCAQAASITSITPLGQAHVPYLTQFQGTTIGGLSGLSWSAEQQHFVAISDDRSERQPARFYTFTVQLFNGRLTDASVQWQRFTTLLDRDGKPYAENALDPEGIALTGSDRVYVSSEGDGIRQIAPFINGYDLQGRWQQSLPMPTTFWPASVFDRLNQGIRNNDAFESLTVTPDRATLYSATETALKQDGEESTQTHGSPARILQYALADGRLLHQYRYDIDPVIPPTGTSVSGGSIGLADMLALDNQGTLLALERTYVKGAGNRIRLYEVSLAGATDINTLKSIRGNQQIVPASKRLVADLADDLNVPLDNFEGLALGPRLDEGQYLLLLISDDNFSDKQRTLIAGFAVTILP
ncbi:hypothetical protein WH50_12045 [Pokkaliibacter plantistimulans]|uniref:Phytase-like domain-containing protein n=1 Tax=Pokkaliibacter plantistimulans TaxID=1635171 RepID=A0ABX5LWD0_9GAMM|nr:esterase-like activity of phytase family protein [Pokkaliibacter plantistimulans]PXF30972.1 hypothetical protein WH50_12045 [Pokkaliibacter plantistimulans]